MAALNLTSTSNSIKAEVTGLDPLHDRDRRFKWYLDGVLMWNEVVEPPISERDYTFAPVYFASQHTSKVEIYDAETAELYFTAEDTISTLYPTITPWSWTASNGTATTFQTMAAKSALDTKGQTKDFSFKVWDDLINKIAEARQETGQIWLPTYGTKPSSLIGVRYGSLMADKFNAAILNIAYPLWSWERFAAIEGYLGRLQVKGVSTMGANADTVYAAYMLELSRKLNLMIGIYNNTGQLTPLASALNIALITAADLVSLLPRVLQVDHTIDLIADAHLLQRPPHPILADAEAILSTVGLLISRPLKQIKADVTSHLTYSAYPIYRLPRAFLGLTLSILASLAAVLDYAHMTYIKASINLSLSIGGLLESNGQKVTLQALSENTVHINANLFYSQAEGFIAKIQHLLYASVLLESGNVRAMTSSSQLTLTTTALLETEVIITWEYPVQTGDDLSATQVYLGSQLGDSLILE